MKMRFRKAVPEDLAQLKSVYQRIIEDMDQKGIAIWDEIYPCAFLEEDIRYGNFYVIENEEKQEIAAAFALLETNSGQDAVRWQSNAGKVLYIDRLGVNVDYARKGIGSMLLRNAMAEAKRLEADGLRLFVVDINLPAIALYEKNGFTRAQGIYCEMIEEDFVLQEYGYEIGWA